MILLDSNVLSEFMHGRPDIRVISWLDRQPRTSVWTTSISVFEIRFELRTLPLGKRRTSMMSVFERLLTDTIQGRISSFDQAAAEQAAQLAAIRKNKGRPGELRDTMIAGIVLASHATLATRNLKHFEEIASSVVNPWEA
jgi:predicted nucleic acid-binding protein